MLSIIVRGRTVGVRVYTTGKGRQCCLSARPYICLSICFFTTLTIHTPTQFSSPHLLSSSSPLSSSSLRFTRGVCNECGHSAMQHFCHFNKHILNPIGRSGKRPTLHCTINSPLQYTLEYTVQYTLQYKYTVKLSIILSGY